MTATLKEAWKAHRHLRGPRVFYRPGTGKLETLTHKIFTNGLKAAERRAGLIAKGNHTSCATRSARI
jgi:hypothetical protein